MKPVKLKLRPVISAEAWLAALASPENRVEIDFRGVPAFYTAQPGWIIEPRPFGQHLLYYVVRGSFRARVSKREYTVEPDTLLWIPPWATFRCWLPDDQPASFYRFRLRLENRRGKGIYRRDARFLFLGSENTRRWFEEIVRTTDRGRQSSRIWGVRAALIGLFAEVQWSKTNLKVSGRLDSRQKQALEELIHREGKVQFTPAQLAAQIGLSPDYFARLFRTTYGISPRAWVVRERIKMAATRLLESHLNIGEVSEEFGYRNIFFFSRQFKQIMGQCPRNYRRTMSR